MGVFLTLKETASELSTQPVNVLRLIALGLLSAIRLDDGWRVDPDELRRYLKLGAPRLAMAPLSARGWFDDDAHDLALGFYSQALAAIDGAVYADAPANLFPRGTLGATVNVPIAGAVATLLARTVPGPAAKLPGKEYPPRNWRDVYLVDCLRRAAFEEVKMPVGLLKPIDRLFGDGPKAFAQRVANASAVMLQRGIERRVPYILDGRQVSITYRLRHADLAAGAVLSRVERLAF